MRGKRVLIASLLLVAVGSFLSARSSDPAGRLAERIKYAEALAEGNQPETAATLLHEVIRALDAVKDEKKRKLLSKRIHGLLGAIDPVNKKRRAGETRLAKEYVGLAKKYKKKGWEEAALQCLKQANVLDPGIARDAGFAPPAEAALSGRAVLLSELFPPGSKLNGWQFGPGYIQAPPDIGKDARLISATRYEKAIRISMEMKVLRVKGIINRWCGLIIGYAQGKPYYSVDMSKKPKVTIFRISQITYEGREYIVRIVTPHGHVTKKGWVPVHVEVKKGQISLSVAGAAPVTALIGDEMPAGRLGFNACGPGDGTSEVGFRKIRLNLQPELKPEVKKVPITASGLLDQAEKIIAAGKVEKAALILWKVEPMIAREPNPGLRRNYNKRCNAALRMVDYLLKPRRNLQARLARNMSAIGRAYLKAGWSDTAARFLAKAEELKPGGRKAKNRNGIKPNKIEEIGGLKELFPGRSKKIGGWDKWEINGSSIDTPGLGRRERDLIIFNPPVSGDFQIDLDLSLGKGDGKGGLVFGFKSITDYFFTFIDQDHKGFGGSLVQFQKGMGPEETGLNFLWRHKTRGAVQRLSVIKKGNTLYTKTFDNFYLMMKISPASTTGQIGLTAQNDSDQPFTPVFKKLRVKRPSPDSLTSGLQKR